MSAFLQHGTLTLVGGTATVVVNNPSAYKVIPARRTPAGALGAGGLDCPNATRTATQFVINAIDLAGALVVTETSTVDWVSMA